MASSWSLQGAQTECIVHFYEASSFIHHRIAVAVSFELMGRTVLEVEEASYLHIHSSV